MIRKFLLKLLQFTNKTKDFLGNLEQNITESYKLACRKVESVCDKI